MEGDKDVVWETYAYACKKNACDRVLCCIIRIGVALVCVQQLRWEDGLVSAYFISNDGKEFTILVSRLR